MKEMIRHKIYVRRQKRGAGEASVAPLIRRCVKAALSTEGIEVPCEVNVLLSDQALIHMLNKKHRGIDRPTDVLSFPAFEFSPGAFEPEPSMTDPGTGRLPLGDIVISMDAVQAQAGAYGHTLFRELAYLTVHSILHLLGYDHVDEGAGKQRMREREEEILSGLGLTE